MANATLCSGCICGSLWKGVGEAKFGKEDTGCWFLGVIQFVGWDSTGGLV